ncbi:MAG TPA: outer membrane beta-barrel protein [Puia sp.]
MEHVNDDMDELFKKAGELYPLKTSESDWDGVMGKLRDEISGEKGIPYAVPARGNSNRRRWLLLILVPAFVFSLIYFSGLRVSEKNTQALSKGDNHPANKNSPVTNTISSPGDQAVKEAPAGPESQGKTTADLASTAPVSVTKKKSDEHAAKETAQMKSAGENTNGKMVASGKILQESASVPYAATETKNHSDLESFPEPVEKALFLSVYGLNENPSVYGKPFPPLVLKDITLNAETSGTLAKTKTDNTHSPKGIYAVVLGGPDFSMVAFQSTEQAGYSIGALLGYRFNKHIAIETGLLWDKKNYYSSGEYFDKSKIYNFPSVETISSVNGNCNMFEIPLNFRYDFANNEKHGFFATAGLSSYLMKKEYYKYNADSAGYRPWTGETTYNNASKNFFSILQLSAGYERTIGRNTKIRIEPYMKIPLQGIGISNMPISSVGLYFGISHSFR